MMYFLLGVLASTVILIVTVYLVIGAVSGLSIFVKKDKEPEPTEED